jgi:hypothetical protein
MEGTRKRGRHCKIWRRNENEEDLNVIGIKNRPAVNKDH